eukprot:105218_1
MVKLSSRNSLLLIVNIIFIIYVINTIIFGHLFIDDIFQNNYNLTQLPYSITNLSNNDVNSTTINTSMENQELYIEYGFEVWLISTIGFNASYLLIPYFISYYTNIGIKYKNILLNININYTTDNITQYQLTTDYLKTSNITYFEWTDHFTTIQKHIVELKLYELVPKTDYILIADVDEFQDWNQRFQISNIYEIIKTELILNNYEYVMGYLMDRFSYDASAVPIAPLSKTDNSILAINKLFKLYPFQCDFTSKIMRAQNIKVCLFKNVYSIKEGGHHFIDWKKEKRKRLKNNQTVGRRYKKRILIHHFKWTNYNIIQYLRARMLHFKSQDMVWWEESLRAIEWFEKNQGNIDLNNGCNMDIISDVK